ncbi:MAG: GNAT family N-acetyltransferase [Aureispira sp.]
MLLENIHNLTMLWKTASLPFSTYVAGPHFDYCYIEDANWPNRVWLHQDIDRTVLEAIKDILPAVPVPLTLPYFDIYKSDKEALLERFGWTYKFEQTAMFLKPQAKFSQRDGFELKKVDTEVTAVLWAKLFKEAFGYGISVPTILQNWLILDYYIAYDQGKAIGTGLLNQTYTTMGIHSIGVPPAHRRRGYADEIMRHLINYAVLNGVPSITLQASSMGKSIYERLGFQEQFLIRNYIAPPIS